MTTDQLLQTAAAMTAYAAGKPVQFQIIGTSEWTDCPRPEWNCMAYLYRPKPEVKSQEQLDDDAFHKWWVSLNGYSNIAPEYHYGFWQAWKFALAYERSRAKP